MSLLYYSDEAARRMERYVQHKRRLETEGATHASLEESRSLAVECLMQIIHDNDETTGYAAMRASLPQRSAA